jgi:hypothetical protein
MFSKVASSMDSTFDNVIVCDTDELASCEDVVDSPVGDSIVVVWVVVRSTDTSMTGVDVDVTSVSSVVEIVVLVTDEKSSDLSSSATLLVVETNGVGEF